MLEMLRWTRRLDRADAPADRSRCRNWKLVAAALVIHAGAVAPAPAQEELQQLLAEDYAEDDHFGRSVAIDESTVVVGAAQEDGETDLGTVGAAYIFEPEGGGDLWGQVRKIAAADALPGDRFGRSVAIDGDTVVVGAWGHPLATFVGAAYVFYRNADETGEWGQVAKLQASDGTSIDYFGISVAVDGDRIVVGASQAFGTGQAYVFERDAGGPDAWGQVALLVPDSAIGGDQFGNAVAIDDDFIVVGARNEGSQGERSGAAYIYERIYAAPAGWVEVTKLVASDGGPESSFGGSVAIEDDLAIIGCRDLETGGGCDAVYVFRRDEGGAENWAEVARLTAGEAASEDGFGWSVALRNGIAMVGAPSDDSGAPDAGAAYVFERKFAGEEWEQIGSVTASDAEISDKLGTTVAISGNFAVAGSFRHDVSGQVDAGAAYLINGVCPCPADLDADWTVGFADLLSLLGGWGFCDVECRADLDGSGDVGFSDLLQALALWGDCPCPP